MKRYIAAAALVLAAVGCQAGGESASTGETAAADAPNLIMEFTDQTTAWQCPNCKMVFDGPGECTMNDGTLMEMAVVYECPQDSTETFEMAGTCPAHDAVIVAHLVSLDAGATEGDDADHGEDSEEEAS